MKHFNMGELGVAGYGTREVHICHIYLPKELGLSLPVGSLKLVSRGRGKEEKHSQAK